jgi:hypothetical protein
MQTRHIAMAAALCLVATACNRLESSPAPAADDPMAAARAVDEAVAEDLTAGRVADARHWLGRADNRLFAGNAREVQRFIDDLYAVGARHVWFTGIERFERASVSASLAVELPHDAVKRSALLRLSARFRGELEPTPDLGQRYLEFAIR